MKPLGPHMRLLGPQLEKSVVNIVATLRVEVHREPRA